MKSIAGISRREVIVWPIRLAVASGLGLVNPAPGHSGSSSVQCDAPRYGRLKDVNTTDFKEAIRLGCHTMQSVFNADDNDVPFMLARARPDARLAFYPGGSEAHVPGRHLNALLNAEDAAGIVIDEQAIEKHRRAAFFSFSGPVSLPLNRQVMDGPLVNFAAHNIREGLHALCALVKFRRDDRARELAEACIAAIFDLWGPQCGWDEERLKRHGINHMDRHENFVRTLPRALGPLVKYYRATGYGPALELAFVLKEKLLAEHFREDGVYDIQVQGTHGHSIACVLSSMAQMAELTQDLPLIRRVKAFYDNGMWKLRDELGWVVEKTGDSAVKRPDLGEANSTGDLIETALILGRLGHPQYFEDAERMLRCHLLPSQLRDIGFITAPANPQNEDGKRDVARRLQGAYGFPAPYGHEPLELEGFEGVNFNLDIVGGVVGSLCEVYRDATRLDATGHHVNLLFDHETEAIKVESIYTHPQMRVILKKPEPLWVRLPPWVRRDRLSLEGVAGMPRLKSSHAFVGQQPVGRPVTFRFDLPTRDIVLRHPTRSIRVRLRGDAVAAMDHFGADLTFFEPLEG